MIRRPPRSTLSSSSAASDVYKRQLLHRAADLVAEREDPVVRNPVVDVRSHLAAAEDAHVGQNGEMLGDVLLRGIEPLRQLVDARLALAKAVEQLDPHRLAEHAEAACDQLDEVIRQWVGQGHALLLGNTVNS